VKTFIVRIWTPADPGDPGGEPLRGLVEQIGAGEATPFVSEAELLEFLIRAAAQPADHPQRDREPALSEVDR
jgi:hypothetical protein